MQYFEDKIEYRSKDTANGNTALHEAVMQQNVEAVQKLFGVDPELALIPNFLGRSPFYVACQKKNMEILQIFESLKSQAIIVQDYLGENMLFVCAREAEVEMFNWFMGSNNFFKARGQQNYKGQTIEHVVCIEGQTKIVGDIRPKLDTKDYYGNLPIHYTIKNDDHEMVEKYFKSQSAYFDLRNFKYETIFHTAAKNNSVKSMKILLGKNVFQEELLKKDFKGDTPIHTAAKSGSLEILKFYIEVCTPNFLQIQNDFGLTPVEALEQKIQMIQEKAGNPEMTKQEKEKLFNKMLHLRNVLNYLQNFDDFVTEKRWNERFTLPLAVYLEMVVDPNLKIFMGMHMRAEVLDQEKKEKYSPEQEKKDEENSQANMV